MFDDVLVPISNKEDALEDLLYSFDFNKEKLGKFKAGVRSRAKFNPAKYDSKKIEQGQATFEQFKKVFLTANFAEKHFLKVMMI